MRDLFDIYTIIFLALAVFIFLRLRSVLGQRTGRERPPYDPYSAREAGAPFDQRQCRDAAAARRGCGAEARGRCRAGRALEGHRRAGLGRRGRARCGGWRRTRASTPKHFLTGARAAYEMIVTAYAQGDRRTLKNLLSQGGL